MNVYLFSISDDPRQIIKSIPDVLPAPVTGSPRGEIAVERPVILIDSTVQDVNYAYIPLFNRYYYIDEIIQVRNNLSQLVMTVDVLMTYWKLSELQSAQILAARTNRTAPPVDPSDPSAVRTGFNAYLYDPRQPVIVPTQEDVRYLGEFIWGSMVLVTMG